MESTTKSFMADKYGNLKLSPEYVQRLSEGWGEFYVHACNKSDCYHFELGFRVDTR